MSFLGSLFGMGRPKVAKAEPAAGIQRVSQGFNEEEKKKGKAAAQLALINTRAGGLTDEATTGRKKLLGN